MTHLSPGGEGAGAARLHDARITDRAGRPAVLISAADEEIGDQVRIRLADGTPVLVSRDMLTAQPDGSFQLPFALEDDAPQAGQARLRLPLQQESLEVGKRLVDTGRGVRLHKRVTEHPATVEQTLLRDELTIEHVPIGQPVAADNPPRTRYEGDTLVVPVLEEVLVVQKQLRLTEELRITRRQQAQQVRRSAPVRTEQVEVERFDEHKK